MVYVFSFVTSVYIVSVFIGCIRNRNIELNQERCFLWKLLPTCYKKNVGITK